MRPPAAARVAAAYYGRLVRWDEEAVVLRGGTLPSSRRFRQPDLGPLWRAISPKDRGGACRIEVAALQIMTWHAQVRQIPAPHITLPMPHPRDRLTILMMPWYTYRGRYSCRSVEE